MTTTDPIAERLADLDQEHIRAAAEFAAEHLALNGVARVRLAPGDMTPDNDRAPPPGANQGRGTHRHKEPTWTRSLT